MLAGIVPPNIRSDVCARMERTKQMEHDAHFLFSHIPTTSSRLKSRKDFMKNHHTSLQKPDDATTEEINGKLHLGMVSSNEESAKEYDSPWFT